MAETFPPEFFRRLDESDDELFYSQPRLVVHIDEGAIKMVEQIYARLLPPGGTILDLMSLPRPAVMAGKSLMRAEPVRATA